MLILTIGFYSHEDGEIDDLIGIFQNLDEIMQYCKKEQGFEITFNEVKNNPFNGIQRTHVSKEEMDNYANYSIWVPC